MRVQGPSDNFCIAFAHGMMGSNSVGNAMETVIPGAPPEGVGGPDDVAQNVATRGVPTQLIILALVAVILLPGIVFSGLLLSRYAAAERAQYQLQSLGVARAVVTILDRQINGLETTLQALSTSTPLSDGDFAEFYRQAERVKTFIGVNIELRRLDGQQIINTRSSWGSALPLTPIAVDSIAISTGSPAVSDVFIDPIADRPSIAIVIPVKVNGAFQYLLSVNAETDRFYDAIKSAVPSNWLIGIADRNGVYVTRSEDHASFSGKPGVPAFLALAAGADGTFIGESAFGEKVLVGYMRSPISNWLIAASIKQAVLEAPLTSALYVLMAFGGIALLIASLVALWLWRFIARPLNGLAIASRRIGTVQGLLPIKTPLREFIALRDALSIAAAQVRLNNDVLEAKVAQRTHELAEAKSALTAQMAAREQIESQLRQSQKMEAVGQLTGGIAHDFNNMLSIVISSLNLLQRRMERGDNNIGRFVDSAMEGAQRAATLTSRLLAFSRQQPLAPQIIDLNRLVADMSELLRRTLGESIKIETVLGAGLWRNHTDPAQIENAVLNLAVNARDAMPEGGRLTIETANAFLDEKYVASLDGVAPGQYVQIAVTDTGGGMTEDVINHAFDPFFTTKKLGMGTGLGLSQVYGFVKQSRGHIKIYSEPEHGTTIKIYLPRHYGDAQTEATHAEVPALLTGSPDEVILVVEDEDKLRHLTVDTLRELGYTVLEANGAAQALDLIDRHGEIDLLFTDIVMPEVSGRKLADEALRRRPDLRVLFTTGFTRNAVVHNGILDTGVNFLPKPFSMEDLAAKIRQALSDDRP